MDTYEKIDSWLKSIMEQGQIEYYKLVGINGDCAEALLYIKTFETVNEKTAIIKPYLNTYKFYVVENKKTDELLDENVIADRITKLENLFNKLLLLTVEGIPKKAPEVSSYKLDKTSLILDFWRQIGENYPDIIEEHIFNGLKCLTADDSLLTEQQKDDKKLIVDWINKYNARHKIEMEIGDLYDLFADISKRLAIIERLAVRHYANDFANYPLADAFKQAYSMYAVGMLQYVDAGNAIDRTDLEDSNYLITSLDEKRKKIKDIVQEEYLSKI